VVPVPLTLSLGAAREIYLRAREERLAPPPR
jgi:hypothetical protein